MLERIATVTLIRETSRLLGLTTLASSSAIIFHHYFFQQSDEGKDSPGVPPFSHSQLVGLAGLFIAIKAEWEKKTKLQHLLKAACQSLGHSSFQSSEELTAAITTREMSILLLLGFDSFVEHPHQYLVELTHGDGELARKSWQFLEDFYETLVPLEYEARNVALSSVAMARKFLYNAQIPGELEEITRVLVAHYQSL
jgi:hypothetical protein